jgi:hypothetical protein
MKRLFIAILALGLALSICACAPGPNELRGSATSNAQSAGFWQGLWHGFIAPVTFIVSLFNKKVNVYEVHNNGNWYNFGFIIGLSAIFGGGGGGAARGRRKRCE